MPVGAAAGCDFLILEKQHQKIAACGSFYRGYSRCLFFCFDAA
jgi:hypothetical protein